MKDFYRLLHCLGVGFLQVKFEEVFSKHATHKDALTLGDIFRMIYANRNVFDPFGWTATVLEWGALYWVAADDDVRSFPFLFPIPLPLTASTTSSLAVAICTVSSVWWTQTEVRRNLLCVKVLQIPLEAALESVVLLFETFQKGKTSQWTAALVAEFLFTLLALEGSGWKQSRLLAFCLPATWKSQRWGGTQPCIPYPHNLFHRVKHRIESHWLP